MGAKDILEERGYKFKRVSGNLHVYEHSSGKHQIELDDAEGWRHREWASHLSTGASKSGQGDDSLRAHLERIHGAPSQHSEEEETLEQHGYKYTGKHQALPIRTYQSPNHAVFYRSDDNSWEHRVGGSGAHTGLLSRGYLIKKGTGMDDLHKHLSSFHSSQHSELNLETSPGSYVPTKARQVQHAGAILGRQAQKRQPLKDEDAPAGTEQFAEGNPKWVEVDEGGDHAEVGSPVYIPKHMVGGGKYGVISQKSRGGFVAVEGHKSGRHLGYYHASDLMHRHDSKAATMQKKYEQEQL